MKTIVGIRFNTGGKVYFFDPAGLEIERGMHVIVDTAKGMEYGTAVDRIRDIEDEKVKAPLKPAKCVPPSFCGILLVKHNMLSL